MKNYIAPVIGIKLFSLKQAITMSEISEYKDITYSKRDGFNNGGKIKVRTEVTGTKTVTWTEPIVWPEDEKRYLKDPLNNPDPYELIKHEEKIPIRTLNYFNGYAPTPHKDLKQSFKYKVVGKNTETNRRKGYTLFAFDEDDAKRRGRIYGLTEPFEVTLTEDNEPTFKQLEAAKRAEITLPVVVTRRDISNIFGILFSKEPKVRQRTVDYSLRHDIALSPYSSELRAKHDISFIEKQINQKKNSAAKARK